MFETSVVIVGAGPTGLLLANLLGQTGVSVLLLDKNPFVSQHPKAILIDDEALRSLQVLGLSEKLSKLCVMGYGARYFNEEGVCFAKIDSCVSEYGYPKRNSFLQPELEKVLEENLVQFSSVTFLREADLKKFSQDEKGVFASFELSSGEVKEVKASFLVGSDGGKSTVRHELGLSLEGFGYEKDWVVLDTENDPDRERYTRFICGYKRPFVSIPAPRGGRRYEFMLLDGEKKEEVLQPSFLQKVLKPYRDELKEEDVTRAAVYHFSACVAERFSEGRVFLAGDSCHLTPPFAGQGMNTGLRDAHNLAWKLERVVKGYSSSKLLDSYELERKKKVSEMLEFAVTLGEIVMPKTELDSRVMLTVWKLAKLIPGAKDYIEKMKFKPKAHYEEGVFLRNVTGGGSQTSPIKSGKMLPQPYVEKERGKKVRLDELLGNSFALIGLGEGSFETVKNFEHRLFPDLKKVYLKGDSRTFPFVTDNPCLILVRPDRYVFLESSLEDFEDQIELIPRVL